MDTIHTQSPEFQSIPANFEKYREFCDEQSQSYRPVGVITEDKYNQALQDPATQLIETEVGQVPLIVPIEYSDGYDIERCKKLTESSSVYLLATPPSSVGAQVVLGVEPGSVIIVESSGIEDDSNRDILTGMLHSSEGAEVQIHEFVDPRIKEEGYKNAYMGLYVSQTEITDRSVVNPEVTGDLRSAFETTGAEKNPENGFTLFSASDLEENHEIEESLWELFKDRFQWLGDYHPVSMEDTRQVFDEIIFSDSTYVTAKFVNGELVCAGIVMHDVSEVDWLKPSTVKRLEDQADRTGTIPMYFFGVAAKSGDEEAINNMQEVVHFHCDLAARANIEYTLTFESSNMSSLYIPRVTEQYINSSGTEKITETITETDELRYWYLAV